MGEGGGSELKMHGGMDVYTLSMFYVLFTFYENNLLHDLLSIFSIFKTIPRKLLEEYEENLQKHEKYVLKSTRITVVVSLKVMTAYHKINRIIFG